MEINKKDYLIVFLIFGGTIVLMPFYVYLFYTYRKLFWVFIVLEKLITYLLEFKSNIIEEILDNSIKNNSKLLSLILSSVIISLGMFIFIFLKFKILFWILILLEFIDAFVLITIKNLKKYQK